MPNYYSDNWKAIALAIKEQNNWCCQCCGKQCYQPQEKLAGYNRRNWAGDILQVHHRNHNPADNRPSNLIPVCAACHLNLHRGGYSSVTEGQLSMW